MLIILHWYIYHFLSKVTDHYHQGHKHHHLAKKFILTTTLIILHWYWLFSVKGNWSLPPRTSAILSPPKVFILTSTWSFYIDIYHFLSKIIDHYHQGHQQSYHHLKKFILTSTWSFYINIYHSLPKVIDQLHWNC